ncbi:MAG: hypothetical protein H6562_07710 [Lewinellaceae bacterium]|nr:hypothetical protein [Lewinellaceae bacterium]
MKKQSLIPILVFALLGFSACRQTNQPSAEAVDDESLTELPNKQRKWTRSWRRTNLRSTRRGDF